MNKSTLQTEFNSPQVSPGFLLWQITNKWQAEQRKVLLNFGLTHVQFVLLASLVWATSKKSFSQKELAEHAKTNVMMTSQVVRMLEKKGLITRKVNIIDGRSFILNPTVAGVKLANKAIKTVEQVDKHFFEKLDKDLHDFIRMMQLLVNQP